MNAIIIEDEKLSAEYLCNLIKKIDKEIGLKVKGADPAFSKFLSNKIPKDTLLNGVPSYFIDSLIKNSNGGDSILAKIFLLKNAQFNSIYKINDIVFPNKAYCIIGYSCYWYDKKHEVYGVIEDMRLLSKTEHFICAEMLKKANSSNVDSIQIDHVELKR